jgi:predicted SAM-dependent methyltransferase
LNLGCGHVPLDGFVNVDMRGLPGVDIIAPVDDIPVGPGTVSEIFSSHLLEHFPQEALRRNLLPYWSSLLAPGGLFRAVVPDGEAMLAKAAEGSYPFHDFREVLFGSQDYTGDFHYNMFTPDSLAELLTEAGFKDIAVTARGRQNGRCYEFEIAAVYAGPRAPSPMH